MNISTFAKAVAGVLLSVGSVAAMSSPSLAQSAVTCPTNLPLVQAGTLTMSINATEPPEQYINKDGKLIGMNVDLGNEIARRLCLKPVYDNVSFDVQIPGLQTKRWDMINTSLTYTPDRSKLMQLMPYSIGALSLVVAAGNPLKVTKPEDLAGKAVGVEIGGVEEQTLHQINDQQVAKGLPALDIRVFNTYGDAFQALGAGQIDAVYVTGTTGKYYQELGKFSLAVTGLYPGSPSAVATVNPDLAKAVVDALNGMLKDGTYAALMEKYGATKIDVWKDWKGQFASYYIPQ